MKSYLQILMELNWPKIYLVPAKQFEAIEGEYLYKRYPDGAVAVGISAVNAPIISLHHGLRGKALRNTIYHEILHILYPWRPHWWVECAAEKLARGGGRGYYSGVYNHSPDELPSREKLVAQIRKQVERFNSA